MYLELAKRLRDAAKMSEALAVLLPHSEGNVTAKLYNEAADAIEELWKKYLASEVDATNLTGWLAEEHAKHRWIPVTERFPEQKKAHYLCLLDDDSIAVVYWSKVPDWVSKGEWTWHNPNWKEVTHWMPLPEPPKEEAE